MKKVAFYTLGCKVNQYETEFMEEKFKENGYEIVDFSENADVYIVNTCSVTAMADRKSRNAIYRAHKINPAALIAVAGCYSQVNPQEFNKMDFVNIVLGNTAKDKIVELTENFSGEKLELVEDISKPRSYTNISVKEHIGKTRAFMKIEDGCDNFCTYCIIPYARGRVRSRSLDDIKSEALALAEAGYKEIVLTGIHLTSYGKDSGGDLTDVLALLEEVPGIERIRLGSLELTPVMEKIALNAEKFTKLCPQFHISLQSGCDTVLKRMNRRYSCDDYRTAVSLLKSTWDNASVTTDIMTGFPGETQEEHEKSLAFAKEIGFSKIHIFPYSRRIGTVAANMSDQLTDKVKRERAAEMQKAAEECKLDFYKSCIGKVFEILVEKRGENGKLFGHSENFCLTEFAGGDELIKTIVRVKITGFSDEVLLGEKVM